MPAWVSDIGLVVVHEILNAEALTGLAASMDSTKTLLYLVNWRKEGYDVNYPDYTH